MDELLKTFSTHGMLVLGFHFLRGISIEFGPWGFTTDGATGRCIYWRRLPKLWLPWAVVKKDTFGDNLATNGDIKVQKKRLITSTFCSFSEWQLSTSSTYNICSVTPQIKRSPPTLWSLTPLIRHGSRPEAAFIPIWWHIRQPLMHQLLTLLTWWTLKERFRETTCGSAPRLPWPHRGRQLWPLQHLRYRNTKVIIRLVIVSRNYGYAYH